MHRFTTIVLIRTLLHYLVLPCIVVGCIQTQSTLVSTRCSSGQLKITILLPLDFLSSLKKTNLLTTYYQSVEQFILISQSTQFPEPTHHFYYYFLLWLVAIFSISFSILFFYSLLKYLVYRYEFILFSNLWNPKAPKPKQNNQHSVISSYPLNPGLNVLYENSCVAKGLERTTKNMRNIKNLVKSLVPKWTNSSTIWMLPERCEKNDHFFPNPSFGSKLIQKNQRYIK